MMGCGAEGGGVGNGTSIGKTCGGVAVAIGKFAGKGVEGVGGVMGFVGTAIGGAGLGIGTGGCFCKASLSFSASEIISSKFKGLGG
ncbi:MAG: hypothetical protein A2458_04900 [Candidatus Kerfeldbacteria bacterium RIFOXYC2_FULL_38_9]|nr:MAG: hypothetical protein A2458_04900 [Candidatus Kerfeldbacteria bacterium RIFOXYC2_FULL_38_9]